MGQTEVRLELEEKLTDLSEQIQELERKYELLSRTLELLKTARDRFLGRYLTILKEKTAEYLSILEPAWKDSIEMDVNLKLRVRQQGILRDPEYFSTGWAGPVSVGATVCADGCVVRRRIIDGGPG